ncbi:MAG: amidohydrolase family protein [Chloroflexi bacterium]|nr:amidohydrolase family protein [Chloroflexota bacterium]
MEDLKVKNGKLVTPDGIVAGGFTVKNGVISALGGERELPAAAREVDAGGLVVLPGLVDPHLHLGLGAERGKSEEKFASDLSTESIAAATGGVTTIISTALFAGAGRGSILPCITRAKELGSQNSLVDFKLTAFVMNETHVGEIPALMEAGVTSFKFLMAYRGQEGRQVGAQDINWEFAFRGFEAIARVSPPGIAMVHAEAAEVIDLFKVRISATGRGDLGAWTESRPVVAEAIDVTTAGLLALQARVPLYFPHISSGMGLKAVQFLRGLGVSVYAETCPHYLTLTRNSPIGNYGKVNPPLRDRDDVDALWKGIQNGVVDTIGTDHATYQRHHKAGSLWECMPGFPGVSATLPLLVTHGVRKGRLSWERLAQITSENPARIFGVYPRKGLLAVGSDADFVIVDPDQEWVLTPATLHSASDFSVYDGERVSGQAVKTFVRGVQVTDKGNPVRQAPYGRYVSPVVGR